MKRKIALIAFIILTFGAIQSFALGIGIEGVGGVGDGTYGNTVLGSGSIWGTFKTSDLPYIGFGVSFWPHELSLGLTADWWLIHQKISGPLSWYLGLGPYVGIHFYDPSYYGIIPVTLGIGGRLPIGLQVFPVRWLEIFGEVAPSVGFNFAHGGNPEWNLQGALGVRFWTDRD